MDQVEELLELYRRTTTPSERRVLLETVRISSPQEFVQLEERILREHVRAMTTEQLTEAIAAHRGLALQQAEELLRDTVFSYRPRVNQPQGSRLPKPSRRRASQTKATAAQSRSSY